MGELRCATQQQQQPPLWIVLSMNFLQENTDEIEFHPKKLQF